MKLKLTFLTAALLCLPTAAQASEARLIGTFGDWAAYSRVDGAETICYVMTKPTTMAPQNVNHGDIYFMVANWKSGAATEQPSLMTGYNLQRNTPPAALVGNTKVPMFVSQNEAFIENNGDEQRLVNSMRGGSIMRVDARSERGTNVSYKFSLKGVTAALQRARATCS